jgi:hypothetical protein
MSFPDPVAPGGDGGSNPRTKAPGFTDQIDVPEKVDEGHPLVILDDLGFPHLAGDPDRLEKALLHEHDLVPGQEPHVVAAGKHVVGREADLSHLALGVRALQGRVVAVRIEQEFRSATRFLRVSALSTA